jgi:hypothetical protein
MNYLAKLFILFCMVYAASGDMIRCNSTNDCPVNNCTGVCESPGCSSTPFIYQADQCITNICVDLCCNLGDAGRTTYLGHTTMSHNRVYVAFKMVRMYFIVSNPISVWLQ